MKRMVPEAGSYRLNTSLLQRQCLILFCFSLILRLLFFHAYLQDNPCQLMYDAGHYHELALSLAQGKGFMKTDGTPQFYRLPGYSLFLAAGYWLFDGNITKTLLLQIVLSAFVPILIYFLALLIFPALPGGATIAGILAALHPGLIIFSGLVMSETLFVFTFLLFLLLFFLAYKRFNSLPLMGGAGVALGLASMIRPIGVPMIGVVIMLTIAMAWWEKRLAGETRRLIALGVGWLCVVSGWLVRNWLLTGYVFFHTLPGVHFLNHTAMRIVMVKEHCTYQQAKEMVKKELDDRIEQQEKVKGKPLLEIEYCKVAEKLAAEIMVKNPLLTLRHAISNMLKTMFSLYASELLVIDAHGQLPQYSSSRSVKEMFMRFLAPKVTSKWIAWFIYYELLFMLFVLAGAVGFSVTLLFKGFNNIMFLFIMSTLLFYGLFVGLSFACGFARLRLPTEPFLIIVTSMFWLLYSKLLFLKKRLESE